MTPSTPVKPPNGKRSGTTPPARSTPKKRKKLKSTLLGHFPLVRPGRVLEIDSNNEKYRKIVAMAERNVTLCIEIEKESALADLQAQLRRLEQTRPHGFYREAAELQKHIEELKQYVKGPRDAVNVAMEIISEAEVALQVHENAKDYEACIVWDEIYNAARKVLHPYLEHLKAEKAAKPLLVHALTTELMATFL